MSVPPLLLLVSLSLLSIPMVPAGVSAEGLLKPPLPPPLLLPLLIVSLALPCVSAQEEVPVIDWAQVNQTAYQSVFQGQGCAGMERCRNFGELRLMNYIQFFMSQCFCDDNCIKYGDCCLEKATKLWGKGEERGSDRYSCELLQEPVSVYMVADCPAEYPDETTVHRCKKTVPDDQYHYRLDLPVYSRNTSTLYSNIYCAFCHEDHRQLATWNITINCSTALEGYQSTAEFLRTASYMPGERQWRALLGKNGSVWDTPVNCFLHVQEFSTLGGGDLDLRRCRDDLIRRCDSEWPILSDHVKCSAYTWIVKASDLERYKNPHCAACNNHNTTECNVQPFNTPVTPTQRYAVSAAVLFDFYGEDVGLERTCGSGEVWDSLFESCFPVHCGANFVLSGDSCQPAPDAANSSDTLLSACAKILLTAAQFEFRQNGSVYVDVYDRVLEPGQFEAQGDGLLVCAADPGGDISFKYNSVQEHISFVCFTLSIVCLAAHILVHTCFSKLRNLPAKNLLSLSCALLMAQLLYLTGVVQNSIFSLCFLFGISIHYFFLASFFWMSVMSVDVCRAFTSDTYRPDARRKSFRLYSLYAWGLPAVIVGVAIFIDQSGVLSYYRPRYATHLCWFNNPPSLGLFFALPVGAVILENAVFFCITVHGIYVQTRASRFAMTRSESMTKARGGKQRDGPHTNGAPQQKKNTTPALTSRQARTEKIRFALYLKLALLMGLGWIFGFVAQFGGPDWLWYPFLIFNGLQGTFIFVAFDLKRKVLAAAVERVTGRRPAWASVSKDSGGPSSGTSSRTAVFKLSQSSQESFDSRLRKLPAALRSKLTSSGSGRSRRAAKQQDSPPKRRSGEHESPPKRRSGEQGSPLKWRVESGDGSPAKRRGAEKQDTSPKRRADKHESPPKPKRAAKQDSPHQRRSQMVRGPSEINDSLLLRLVSHGAPAASVASAASSAPKPTTARHDNGAHESRGAPGSHGAPGSRSSRRRARDDSHVPEPGPSRSPPPSARRAGSFESLPSSERLEHKIAEAKRLLRDLAEQPAEKRRPREKRHGALRSPLAEEGAKRRSASTRDDRREKDRKEKEKEKDKGAVRSRGISRFR